MSSVSIWNCDRDQLQDEREDFGTAATHPFVRLFALSRRGGVNPDPRLQDQDGGLEMEVLAAFRSQPTRHEFLSSHTWMIWSNFLMDSRLGPAMAASEPSGRAAPS